MSTEWKRNREKETAGGGGGHDSILWKSSSAEEKYWKYQVENKKKDNFKYKQNKIMIK